MNGSVYRLMIDNAQRGMQDAPPVMLGIDTILLPKPEVTRKKLARSFELGGQRWS